MEQIIVAQEQVYAAKVGGGAITDIKEINELLTGAIAIFTDKGALVTTVNMAAILDDVKGFFIVVGNQQSTTSAKNQQTIVIPRVGTEYVKEAYVAPVKNKKYVGYDGTSGTNLQTSMPAYAVGNVFSLKITNTTPGMRTVGAMGDEQEVYRYEYVGKQSDTNLTSITALIAKVNADQYRIVDAVVVGAQTGIALTAVDNGTTFAISLGGSLEGATILEQESVPGTNSVAVNFGKGTADQVLAVEDALATLRGNTNRMSTPQLWYKNQSLVVSGETYNIYNFNFSGVRQGVLGAQPTYKFRIMAAVPNGTAVATSFETIMAEIFGGVFTTSTVETGA